MKVLLIVACLIIFVSFTKQEIFAQDYVLPYPSFMPGSPFYKISEIFDWLKQWYSFGNLTQFKYHLSQADKKLVEAKTLFEYKQYLLANDALSRYGYHLRLANTFLAKAKGEGKDISQKSTLFKEAIVKHRDVLEKLKQEAPSTFLWRPEKNKPKLLEIHSMLNQAIELGKSCEEDKRED